MKTFIAVTRYLGKTKNKELKFHFKGVFNGNYIKLILVEESSTEFILGSDYILHLRLAQDLNGVLKTSLIKYKNMSEVFWQ